MSVPLIFDLTRLLTRLVSSSPNGIDRVDHTYAQHFLCGEVGLARCGVVTAPHVNRVLGSATSRRVVAAVRSHWREGTPADTDTQYVDVLEALEGRPTTPRKRFKRKGVIGSDPVLQLVSGLRPSIGLSPAARLPRGGIYLNVSQFPLWIDTAFSWLARNRNISGVFFIHDLLPFRFPEYFRPAEFEIHRQRMETLARYGAAAIVSTTSVADDLRTELARLGRRDFPIHVATLPVSSTFSAPPPISNVDWDGHPFFVFCSTIEPRKNHLMILHVWRELIDVMGDDAPNLVLVGRRGWENENILDLLERCPRLKKHVVEISGMSTPALRALMARARALLMPSFAEGFGLPVAEALAARTPVLCSDIATFREIGGATAEFIDPIDGAAWREAILDYAAPNSPRRAAALERLTSYRPTSRADYFARVEEFLADIAARNKSAS